MLDLRLALVSALQITLALLVIFLAGCATDQQLAINAAAVEVEASAVAANDFILEKEIKLICASPFSAIKRRFAGDDEGLRALMRLCDWNGRDIQIMVPEK